MEMVKFTKQFEFVDLNEQVGAFINGEMLTPIAVNK